MCLSSADNASHGNLLESLLQHYRQTPRYLTATSKENIYLACFVWSYDCFWSAWDRVSCIRSWPGTCNVTRDDLKHLIFSPLPPQCWDYRQMSPSQVFCLESVYSRILLAYVFLSFRCIFKPRWNLLWLPIWSMSFTFLPALFPSQYTKQGGRKKWFKCTFK